MASTKGGSGDLATAVLHALAEAESILTAKVFPGVKATDLKAALDRLKSRSMISYETLEQDAILLEPEGEQVAAHGSHEAQVFEALRKAVDGLTISDLEKAVGDKTVTKLGQGKAFREKWIAKTSDGKLKAVVPSITDQTRQQLLAIQKTHACADAKVVAELRKRKLVRLSKVVEFRVHKAARYALEMVQEETELTADMLASGSWKTATFKPYNFAALGADQHAGTLHPLNKVRHEFRHIFFEMGFEEMPTDHFVESGFWNFDTLFVPQQHPARDLQDTFYISDPVQADPPRPGTSVVSAHTDSRRPVQRSQADYRAYWDNVRAVHQDGKYDSIGYRYPWSPDESLRLVLRTHTTAISAAMLYKLAARTDGPGGKPPPARYFSIDRVFRNESVDATHLAEFHQVEGVIADYGLTLGGLMEFMEIFFGKMGLHDLKFKPAYNPYTEPSMEIFSYHHGLKKLVEIGNSGMFRPEMLEAMGLPREMRVYGWGLSLERPTMIKYGISNIRELLGHKVDLNFIKRNPAVRLDKD